MKGIKPLGLVPLWLYFYVRDFYRQEHNLWKKPIEVDETLVIVRTIHLGLLMLGFIVGAVVPYPHATPPAILGGILIAFVFGTIGFYLAHQAEIEAQEQANSPWDVMQLGPFTFYRPRGVIRSSGVQEEPKTYTAKPWCDLAFGFLFVSVIRIAVYFIFHHGSI